MLDPNLMNRFIFRLRYIQKNCHLNNCLFTIGLAKQELGKSACIEMISISLSALLVKGTSLIQLIYNIECPVY